MAAGRWGACAPRLPGAAGRRSRRGGSRTNCAKGLCGRLPRVKSAFESELPCRLRVCVRPVRAATWPLAQMGVRLPKLPFYLRAERAPFGTGYLRVSVRLTVHTLLRLGLSEAALCR